MEGDRVVLDMDEVEQNKTKQDKTRQDKIKTNDNETNPYDNTQRKTWRRCFHDSSHVSCGYFCDL